MATGKTLGKYSKIYIGGYDMSGDSNAWNIGLTFPEVGATTVASTQNELFCGIPAVMGEVKTWFNATATTGSFDLLKAPGPAIVCIAQGIMAAPAVGDPAFCADINRMDFRSEAVLNAAIKADAKLSGAEGGTSQVNNIFGVVLHANGQETSTTTGAAVNGLAAVASAGALCFLQVTAAGGVWAFTVESSANGSTGWGTIATFTANGSAIAAETQAVSGAVLQYTRCVATKTSGNATYFCAIVRGL